MKICAVIPAAGLGTRLGLPVPKILAPIREDLTVWSVLRDTLIPSVERVVVVLSPSGVRLFQNALASDIAKARVSVEVQKRPAGSGDAVFTALPVWQEFESILIVWGDQVNVSKTTIRATLANHEAYHEGCTIPVVRIPNPYVQYDLDAAGRLYRIRQTRERDEVDPNGFSDVGMFALSTKGLKEAWQDYILTCRNGCVTNEVNFLPFLVFIAERGWPVRLLPAQSTTEALGINTPADLAAARRRFAHWKPEVLDVVTRPEQV